jgi:hypothetical protein
VFDVDCNSWTQIIANGGPGPRAYHGMALVGDEIYIFGGVTNAFFTATNRVDAFNITSGSWRQVLANDYSREPVPRDGKFKPYLKFKF